MEEEREFILNIGEEYISWSPAHARTGSYDNKALFRKAKLRNNEIVRTVKSFTKTPGSFVSIVGEDIDICAHEDLTEERVRKCHDDFKELQNAIRSKFTNCWFFWKMEWSRKSGVHYHLCGNFNSKLPKEEAFGWLSRRWNSICGLDSENTVNVVKYDHNGQDGLHAAYMTTPKKRQNDMVLLSVTRGIRTHGFINKQKAPICSITQILVTEHKMKELRGGMVDDLMRQSKEYKKNPNSEQIRKVSSDKSGLHVFNSKAARDQVLKTVIEQDNRPNVKSQKSK